MLVVLKYRVDSLVVQASSVKHVTPFTLGLLFIFLCNFLRNDISRCLKYIFWNIYRREAINNVKIGLSEGTYVCSWGWIDRLLG